MAKKLTFLLVFVTVLLLASVTAFAAGTDSSSPEIGFTEEKANAGDKSLEVSVSDLEGKYDFFLDEKATSDKNYIEIKYQREYSVVNDLRHTFTGSVTDTSTSAAISENPVIMLMYIKVDGKYVRLNDVTTGANVSEGSFLLPSSKVDLVYLGSGKVNDVRIIAFRKNDMEKLALNVNVQIYDTPITVPHWKLSEKKNITFNDLKNNLTPVSP